MKNWILIVWKAHPGMEDIGRLRLLLRHDGNLEVLGLLLVEAVEVGAFVFVFFYLLNLRRWSV